jgi:tRNA pseudouridine32 synthase/23S rRNA pseudouridine746 synthase
MASAKQNEDHYFIPFEKEIKGIQLPEKFTFPFYYEPHPLAEIASQELQSYLEKEAELNHDFGLAQNEENSALGKMFGVLVVENSQGKLGYLAGFSGKIGGTLDHEGFVPPIFDMLADGTSYQKGQIVLSELTRQIEKLEQDPELSRLQSVQKEETKKFEEQLASEKATIKERKKARKQERTEGQSNLSPSDYTELDEKLRNESQTEQYFLKDFNRYWRYHLSKTKLRLERIQTKLEQLKETRRATSNSLQKQLFDHYQFLSIAGKTKGLVDIFAPTPFQIPPSGAGDCAAPKLLQYAFKHQLKPICMAEFWWGVSPKSEIRQHKQYYPSCRGKCEPILEHMLSGMQVDENPMLTNPALGKMLPILFEDDSIIIVNKPAEFLSVPGKMIDDSVLLRMRQKYPDATGPMIVHRLDMSTSGIMVLAKTKDTYHFLQRQFVNRIVKKRYVALLEGEVVGEEGTIDLPIRVDLMERPKQLVDFENGKKALTEWKVIERLNGRTKVHFQPITGRTHQLRVHSAFTDGLNCPIVGDDLYGRRADRLHLHAQQLTFKHPETKEFVTFEVDEEF